MEAGAVDHIGQQHPREQRPRLESEAGLSGVEHIQAGEVCRQQITGEAHALEGEGKHPRQGFSQGRFPHARLVFDQQMTTGQQTTERQAHLMLFAQEHSANSINQWQQL